MTMRRLRQTVITRLLRETIARNVSPLLRLGIIPNLTLKNCWDYLEIMMRLDTNGLDINERGTRCLRSKLPN